MCNTQKMFPLLLYLSEVYWNYMDPLKLEKIAGDFSLKALFINLSAHVFLLGKKYLTRKYQLYIVVAKKR